MDEYWAELEKCLLAQQDAGTTIDAVVKVGPGAEDKIIVKGRPGSFTIVPRGAAKDVGLIESRRETIRDAVATARREARARGLRAVRARFGHGKHPDADARNHRASSRASRVVVSASASAADPSASSATSSLDFASTAPSAARTAGAADLPGVATTSVASFVAFAREQLRDILDLSGQVLYSGASTLRKGEVYLLGLNPGGDPNSRTLMTIDQSLADLLSPDNERREKNSYMVPWPASNTLRLRIVWLLQSLGFQVPDVAASNLIFPRSKDETTCRYDCFANTCWAVHERIIDVVRPRVVLTYGSTPYRFLSERFGRTGEVTMLAGHGTWECRAFDVPGRFHVVGVPHMSLYAIDHHPEVVRWIKSLVEKR